MSEQIDMFAEPVVAQRTVPAVVVDPPPQTEAAKRDAVLDRYEDTRETLLEAGRRTALALCGEHDGITSVMVLARLRADGWGAQLDAVDSRWAGGVFRTGQGWKRVGYRPDGSHCRPVAVWVRS